MLWMTNKQAVVYTDPVMGKVLQEAGDPDSIVDVSSEITGLSSADYTTLQNEQNAGKIIFTKDAAETFETPFLTIFSSTHVYDDSQDPRMSVVSPASPVYFDSNGRSPKGVEVEGLGAALVLWKGSIDVSTTDNTLRRSRVLGIQTIPGPGVHPVPQEITAQMATVRFLEGKVLKGAMPKEYRFYFGV